MSEKSRRTRAPLLGLATQGVPHSHWCLKNIQLSANGQRQRPGFCARLLQTWTRANRAGQLGWAGHDGAWTLTAVSRNIDTGLPGHGHERELLSAT